MKKKRGRTVQTEVKKREKLGARVRQVRKKRLVESSSGRKEQKENTKQRNE